MVEDNYEIYHFVQGHHYAVLAVSGSAGKAPKDDPLKAAYSEIDIENQVAAAIENSSGVPLEQNELISYYG